MRRHPRRVPTSLTVGFPGSELFYRAQVMEGEKRSFADPSLINTYLTALMMSQALVTF